ncbi:MAG: hypothetical protein U9P36_14015 [Thermodesulfobacteriota bacterium]|nr:hypothetical protein [Thermodesulfobacteriota bacterium]MEA2116481.1 hypothetical protein [Thermodesulfobacteriota bacterium]
MIKLRIIPYFKFAKCSPKASRCDRTCFVAAGAGIGNYRSLRLPAYSCAQRICSRLDL